MRNIAVWRIVNSNKIENSERLKAKQSIKNQNSTE